LLARRIFDAVPRLVRRIFCDEHCDFVIVVEVPHPATGATPAHDHVFLHSQINLWKLAIFAADILADKFVKRRLKYVSIMVAVDNCTLTSALFVGVRALGDKLKSKPLGGVLRWPLQRACNVTHVDNARLTAVSAALFL